MNTNNASSSTRVISETSTPSAEEIKKYKSKISQILKTEYQIEVEIKKDNIKVVDDVFVNEKLEEIENETFKLRNRNDILYQNKSKVVEIEKMLNNCQIFP